MPKRILKGTVLKKSSDKTISVLVVRKCMHPLLKKVVRISKKYLVHDEKQESKVGDKVSIVESRPFSKTKFFELMN